ncbi:GntR family transcriptional regulator [Paenibacillus sediminis]
MMKQKSVRERSSDMIEKKVVKAIIENKFPVDSSLPSERDLANDFGVGRPTVREALQRLCRDGWIEMKRGQSAIVNDYWRKGNLTTLENIIQHHDAVPDEFVVYLLELRLLLAPSYTREAVTINQAKVIAMLAHLDEVEDDPESYARFDWDIQKGLVRLTSNPVYLLIMNSFDSFYINMATKYFDSESNRKFTAEYYENLLKAVLQGDSTQTERIVRDTMEQSIILWNQKSRRE